MDDLLALAQALHTTFSSKDLDERQNAQQVLNRLSTDSESYIQLLISLIASQQEQFQMDVKQSATLSLRRFLRQKVDSQALTFQQRQQIGYTIINLLLGQIQKNLKIKLSHSLIPIINLDGGEPNKPILHSLLQIIPQNFKGNKNQVTGACKLVSIVYQGYNSHPLLFQLFKLLLPLLLDLILNQSQILTQTSDPNIALESTQVLLEVVKVITAAIEHFELVNNQILGQIKDLYQLAQAYTSILSLNLMDPQLGSPQCICISENELHKNFNQTKTQILLQLNVILSYLMVNRKQLLEKEGQRIMTLIGIDMPDSPFVNILYNLIEPLTASVHLLTQLHNFDSIITRQSVSDFILEIFLVLNKISSENKFSPFFSAHYKELIVQMCMDFLRAHQADIESMEDNPQQFVDFSDDLCDKKESEKVTTAAAQLLQGICSSIDGALAFTVLYSCQLIGSAISGYTLQHSPHLNLFPTAKILQLPVHIQIQAGMISLSCISSLVLRRTDLIRCIQNTIQNNWGVLVQVSSALVSQRFGLLIYKYAQKLFQKNLEMFSNLVIQLLHYLVPGQYSKAVSIQASITTKHLFTNQKLSAHLYQIMQQIFQQLVELLPIQLSNQLLSTVQEVALQNFQIVKPHLEKLTVSLFQVIQNVFLKQGVSKKDALMIFQTWNILSIISNHSQIKPNQLLQIQKIISPIFECIKEPEVNFQDEIYFFELSVMKKCGYITPAGWSLFPYMPSIQDKNEGIFLFLFPVINGYLVYGKDVMVAYPENIKTVCDMSYKALFAVYKQKVNEASNAEAALILQIVLQQFPGYINSFLSDILSYTIMRLMNQIRHGFFKAKLLGVILNCILYNSQQTIQILSSSLTPRGETYLFYSIKEILQNVHIFSNKYDRKVASLGLLHLLMQESLPAQIAQFIPVIFQVLISILATAEHAQNSRPETDIKLLNQLTQKGNLSLMKASRFHHFQDLHNHEQLEASLSIQALISPIQGLDEFAQFKHQMNILLTQQADSLRYLVSKLNKPQVEQLNNIIKSKKVAIAGGEKVEVRRILKAKHRCNQIIEVRSI